MVLEVEVYYEAARRRGGARRWVRAEHCSCRADAVLCSSGASPWAQQGTRFSLPRSEAGSRLAPSVAAAGKLQSTTPWRVWA